MPQSATPPQRSYHPVRVAGDTNLSTHETLAGLLAGLFSKANTPVLIAVGGPGGTGKSTFCERLAACLPESKVLGLDHYKAARRLRKEYGVNGPHPKANQMILLGSHLRHIKSGRTFHKPVHFPGWGETRMTEPYNPARFNLLDGEISTYPEFADLVDFSIFIDSDIEVQLQTRLERDTTVRGLSQEDALDTFLHSNLLEFSEYGAGTKWTADVHLRCLHDYSHEWEAIAVEHHEEIENLRLEKGVQL